MRNRSAAMDPSARDGAAQGLAPRRRPRLPGGVSAIATAPILSTAPATAPAPRQQHDDQDTAPAMPTKPRARLPLRQRRPANPVPIAPPQIAPLSSRPVPRPRGSSVRGVRASPAPLTFSGSEFPFELSSSLSSTASCASSASSRMTEEGEETCESSLSEPDLGFEVKGGSMVSVPVGARVREFVGEGSANVVVGIELPEGTDLATRRFFEGMFPGTRVLGYEQGRVVVAVHEC